VLVDEFQDTDPIQWQILHRAFVHEGVTLVLIADPKQAIYAFRGADVYAYLVAAKTATRHATLGTNRRSDQPLLDAYDALFGSAKLGHEGIVYRKVEAAPENRASGLRGAPCGAALRVRIVHRDEPTVTPTYSGPVTAGSAREHIARDLADDVVKLLDSEAALNRSGEDGAPAAQEPIKPGHLAVLVRSNSQAALVSDHLRAAGIPAVINGAGSVFGTPAAKDWLRLLEALERPAAILPAKTVALTAFVGWSAEHVATATEQQWEDVHRRLHRWGRILRNRGVAALTETIAIGEGLPARMLAFNDGERKLTDVRHLAQLLHATASAERLGPTALRGWLAERTADAIAEDREEEQTRRLESDADAVQVMTIHRSKGLEFPVVYCPFLWDYYAREDPEPILFHDPDLGDRCTVDVGLDQQSFKTHQRQHLLEERGEDLRLAYVALTRARHQVAIWWAGSSHGRHSPLTRLVFAQDPDGNVTPHGPHVPTDRAAVDRFNELKTLAPDHISVEKSSLGPPQYWSPPLDRPAELEAAGFDRQLDLRWRRTSYSDITANAHDAIVGSEPEDGTLSDEPEMPTPAPEGKPADADPQLDQSSPLANAPIGAEFGTFVHRTLEAVDFNAKDLDAELADRGARASRRGDGFDAPETLAGLRAAIDTPLGRMIDGLRLRDVGRADRLDELGFELPLAGGDDPTGRVTLSAIAAALLTHLPAHDPMAAYASRLEDPMLRSSVRGFLTGSIDLVVRLAGPRFAIVDYKTNWLGPFDGPLTLRHYHPTALAAEMARGQYGLQALLYTVALHRYLRWRVHGYDPDRQLVGVLYLFLRGMAGEQTPTSGGCSCGVFAWRPPGVVVQAVSDVLDGVDG
jgi:exodeoxyribonuclease V beta subunit